MRRLFMRDEYIVWTKEGLKTATTRLKAKPFGQYELVSGSWFKPEKSGVKIETNEIINWSLGSATEQLKRRIVAAEHFANWDEFIFVLCEINKISEEELADKRLFTHFYSLLS